MHVPLVPVVPVVPGDCGIQQIRHYELPSQDSLTLCSDTRRNGPWRRASSEIPWILSACLHTATHTRRPKNCQKKGRKKKQRLKRVFPLLTNLIRPTAQVGGSPPPLWLPPLLRTRVSLLFQKKKKKKKAQVQVSQQHTVVSTPAHRSAKIYLGRRNLNPATSQYLIFSQLFSPCFHLHSLSSYLLLLHPSLSPSSPPDPIVYPRPRLLSP